MCEKGTVEFNYYWGDDSFHSGVRLPKVKGADPFALAEQHKPKHASVSHALIYVNGLYQGTVELC